MKFQRRLINCRHAWGIWRRAFPCAAVLAILLVGCGKPGTDLSTVSGRVTLDGEPLAGARVRFQPEAAGGSPSYGSTDQEGRYELSFKRGQKGALIGWHTVRVEASVEPAEAEGKAASRPRQLPARYNDRSELREEVKADEDNEIDFALTFDGK